MAANGTLPLLLCFIALLAGFFLLLLVILLIPKKTTQSRATPTQPGKRLENEKKPVQMPTMTTHRNNLDKINPQPRSYSPNVVCPHGVPKVYFCAICDEEKFREMTGIDLHNE
jgi:hypothetical protein